MRKRIAGAVFFGSVACMAAQSGAEITMPPNSKQEGLFSFANSCPTDQVYRFSTEPEANWLHFQPPTVKVGPGTSFAVRVAVNTARTRKLGAYSSSLRVICESCAATDPPCLQDVKEFPINLTIANVESPGNFEPIAPPAPPPAPKTEVKTRPVSLISPAPMRIMHLPLLPTVGFGLLAAGSIAMLLAVRGLSSAGRARTVAGDAAADNQGQHGQGS